VSGAELGIMIIYPEQLVVNDVTSNRTFYNLKWLGSRYWRGNMHGRLCLI
jgi:hypothetical protein